MNVLTLLIAVASLSASAMTDTELLAELRNLPPQGDVAETESYKALRNRIESGRFDSILHIVDQSQPSSFSKLVISQAILSSDSYTSENLSFLVKLHSAINNNPSWDEDFTEERTRFDVRKESTLFRLREIISLVLYGNIEEGLHESSDKKSDGLLLIEQLEKASSSVNGSAEIKSLIETLRDQEKISSRDARGLKRSSTFFPERGESLASKSDKNAASGVDREASENEKSSNRLPWIIVGVLFVGIFALLFNIFKGKSTS